MLKSEKYRLVDEITEKLNNNENYYFADASGMTVDAVDKFRQLCYEKGVEYKVYKNTLLKKALEKHDSDFESLDDVLKGFTGVIFSKDVANLPAKVLTEFQKKHGGEKPVLKAASILSELYIGANQLSVLYKLKSKNELIGDLVTLLHSPALTVVGQLQSSALQVTSLLKGIEEKKIIN